MPNMGVPRTAGPANLKGFVVTPKQQAILPLNTLYGTIGVLLNDLFVGSSYSASNIKNKVEYGSIGLLITVDPGGSYKASNIKNKTEYGSVGTLSYVPLLTSTGVKGTVYVDADTANPADSTNLDSTGRINLTDPAVKFAQGFTPSINENIVGGSIYVTQVGSPSDGLTIEVWDDLAGIPNTVLASITPTLPTFPYMTEVEVPFTFNSAPALTAGSVYYIVTYRTAALADSTNYWQLSVSPSKALSGAQKYS